MQTAEGRMMKRSRALLVGAVLLVTATFANAQASPLPQLVERAGKHALFVDGSPFLILGAQTNNSSNYATVLPDVWPMVDQLHANTLEIPIAWEQVEPIEGKFDFSWVDTLLAQARAHN